MQAEEKKKPGWERFFVVFGLVLAFLIPLLQANGVDVNWWVSLIAYAIILGVCVWSFLWHAIPDRQRRNHRIFGTILILVSIGSLGTFATLQQYERDHADNLRTVRIVDVISRQQVANSLYVFQIDIENLSEKDIKADFACVVAKPTIPIKPFGIIGDDTSKEHELEEQLFRGINNAEKSVTPQDLPEQRTVHVYCPSSWVPSQEELTKLEHGDFVLYVAGRIRIPSKVKGAHIDVDFCRSGDEKHGLLNCFGHNVPHVHLPQAAS